MNAEETIASLRRRLWIERGVSLCALLCAVGAWAAPALFPSVWAVYVDGKPLVATRNRGAIAAALEEVRAGAGPGAAFAQQVKLERADPAKVEITDPRTAEEKLKKSLKLSAPRAVLYIDGQAVVALRDEAEARRVLDGVKSTLAGKLDDLASEPRFKEQVEVRTEPAVQELWADPDTALGLLRGDDGEESTHAVAAGENAWSIARHYRLSEATFHQLNPNLDAHRLKIGQAVRVSAPPKPLLTVLTEGRLTTTKPAPYATLLKHSAQMYAGKSFVARPGKPGRLRVTYRVECENGRVVKREAQKLEVLAHSQPKIVVLGEKPRPGG